MWSSPFRKAEKKKPGKKTRQLADREEILAKFDFDLCVGLKYPSASYPINCTQICGMIGNVSQSRECLNATSQHHGIELALLHSEHPAARYTVPDNDLTLCI